MNASCSYPGLQMNFPQEIDSLSSISVCTARQLLSMSLESPFILIFILWSKWKSWILIKSIGCLRPPLNPTKILRGLTKAIVSWSERNCIYNFSVAGYHWSDSPLINWTHRWRASSRDFIRKAVDRYDQYNIIIVFWSFISVMIIVIQYSTQLKPRNWVLVNSIYFLLHATKSNSCEFSGVSRTLIK